MVQKQCRATRLREAWREGNNTTSNTMQQVICQSFGWKRSSNPIHLNYKMLLAREYNFSEQMVVDDIKCKPSKVMSSTTINLMKNSSIMDWSLLKSIRNEEVWQHSLHKIFMSQKQMRSTASTLNYQTTVHQTTFQSLIGLVYWNQLWYHLTTQWTF